MPDVAPLEPESPSFPRMQGVGDDGFVNIDVACRQCGYDLRALSADARCPECGTEVLASLRSEQLCDADPTWVMSLSRGAYWIAGTLIVQFVATCILRPILPRFLPPMDFQGRWIDMPFLIPWIAGVWMLTRPDPSGRGELEYGRLRRGWWWLAIALVALDCIDLIAVRGSSVLMPITRVAQAAMNLATAVVGLRYLFGLSRRMSDRSLQWRAHLLSISFGIFNAGILCLALANLLRINVKFGPGFLPLIAIALLVYAITAVMYVGMLGSLGDRLRSQSLLANAIVSG
ncbi:hypothetical protein BH09PLA1_BH09PLA1_09510 [soil metagenome]